MLTMRLQGEEFPLSSKLRVAYIIQGQHGHKPYIEIFENLQTMPLQDQIRILFAAFKVANPDLCVQPGQRNVGVGLWTEQAFIDAVLDDEDISLGSMLNLVRDLLQALMSIPSEPIPEEEVPATPVNPQISK